ncbi:MAG: hypothetical protein JWR23_2709 [Mucilaginibacter sp.]|nr:hypothetical protein [Mucilaginibacter sp.]
MENMAITNNIPGDGHCESAGRKPETLLSKKFIKAKRILYMIA